MARKTVKSCRFYADLLQYIKATGMYSHVEVVDIVSGNDDTPLGAENIFDMNPYRQNIYSVTAGSLLSTFNFWLDELQNPTEQPEFSELLSVANYGGVLGSNISDLYGDMTGFTLGQTDYVENIVNSFNQSFFGVGAYKDGYSLWKLTPSISNILAANQKFEFGVAENSFSGAEEGTKLKLGAVTCGIYFDTPHSPELTLSIEEEYEGVSFQRTIEGGTISNTNHLGVPSWGELPAWAISEQDDQDYNVGGRKGRRSWDVSFSFLSDDSLFSSAGNINPFFTYNDYNGEYTFDDSMASFFKLTYNGKIPFIFCPDSSLTNEYDLEFAICVIEDTPVFTQVANQTWSVSMRIVEVW